MQAHRYRPVPTVDLPQRSWPDQEITAAPMWCSVDLRDGNQALIEPMGSDRKLLMFETLVKMGFREIEVGFPAASQTDFDFVRQLIEEHRIPEGVTIQVLTQARQSLIDRTVEAVQGAPSVILHLYNSTSTLQRRVVFGLDKAAVKDLAIQGTQWVKEAAKALSGSRVILEYSPESFSATEVDYATEVCDAVIETWAPAPGEKVILNLPATVEMTTANRYADQIEWVHRHLRHRDQALISIHTHNDRGCSVAATELALLAGADRVEGTLFGNGERTGNVDVVTVALNLYTQGIDPGLDLSNLPALVKVAEHCNRLPVPARHPYAGELVFTAFSGSHQDAIRKGLEALKQEQNPYWEVPYLPIDPADVGRQYEPIIRINSQSGKGGVAFLLEQDHGFAVPKALAQEFSQVVQRITDRTGEELSSDQVFQAFEREYLGMGRFELVDYETHRLSRDQCRMTAKVLDAGRPVVIQAEGNGPIDAFLHGFQKAFDLDIHVSDYSEHALGRGESAEAIAYVLLRTSDGSCRYGVGRHADILEASLQAVLSSVNRQTEGDGGLGEEAAS